MCSGNMKARTMCLQKHAFSFSSQFRWPRWMRDVRRFDATVRDNPCRGLTSHGTLFRGARASNYRHKFVRRLLLIHSHRRSQGDKKYRRPPRPRHAPRLIWGSGCCDRQLDEGPQSAEGSEDGARRSQLRPFACSTKQEKNKLRVDHLALLLPSSVPQRIYVPDPATKPFANNRRPCFCLKQAHT